jgi:hypothetical protein
MRQVLTNRSMDRSLRWNLESDLNGHLIKLRLSQNPKQPLSFFFPIFKRHRVNDRRFCPEAAMCTAELICKEKAPQNYWGGEGTARLRRCAVNYFRISPLSNCRALTCSHAFTLVALHHFPISLNNFTQGVSSFFIKRSLKAQACSEATYGSQSFVFFNSSSNGWVGKKVSGGSPVPDLAGTNIELHSVV